MFTNASLMGLCQVCQHCQSRIIRFVQFCNQLSKSRISYYGRQVLGGAIQVGCFRKSALERPTSAVNNS